MKSISLILASLFCASSPLLAQAAAPLPSTTQTAESQLSLGADLVREVRSDYSQGKYDRFLQEMEADYQSAQAEGELTGLIEIRKEDALILAARQEDKNHWAALGKSWTQERNLELLKLVSAQPESILAKKIQSIAAEISAEEEQAINLLIDLRKQTPGSSESEEMNLLIEIDLQAEYKQLHLDSMKMFDPSLDGLKEKHIVLDMEKMDQMLEASKSFQNLALKKQIELAGANLDERLSRSLDLSDLNRLSRGKIASANEAEKKAASILSSYQGKFSDLTKEMFEKSQAQQ